MEISEHTVVIFEESYVIQVVCSSTRTDHSGIISIIKTLNKTALNLSFMNA